MAKRVFTIELEIQNITKEINKASQSCRAKLYGSDNLYGLTSGGAKVLLNKVPMILHRHIKSLFDAYSTILKEKDIKILQDYIELQRRQIISLTVPSKLKPSSLSTHDGESLDDLYVNERKKLVSEFNNNIKTTHQRIDNSFLRHKKNDKYTFWIPTIFSTLALLLSAIGLIIGVFR